MKIFMAIAMIVVPLSASAECIKYHYGELKDMTQAELQSAYAENQKESLTALQWGNKFLENGDRGSISGKTRSIRSANRRPSR